MTIAASQPSFAHPLYVGRPNIGDRNALMARIEDMLDRRWFSNNGPLVQEFEQAVARRLNIKNCIATCNATVALELAIRALGFKDEVIVPSFSFIATAHALQWQGITPVFADINPVTHNMDPGSIERLITSRTTGIIGVHLWGRGCDTDAIQGIADRHSLRVMYDASHGFGCSVNGTLLGAFGACEVFSFHATKFINCFEGGVVVTHDDELAGKLRLMRNFGFEDLDKISLLGLNGKMSEVCAAMGLTSLEAADDIIAINRRNYEAYRRGLAELPELAILHYDPREHHNFQYVVIELDPAKAKISRDELVVRLHAEKIIARKYFWPGCHQMEPYRTSQPDACKHLPETERVSARVIVLPTGQSVSESDVHQVCEIIRRALK